MWLTSLLVTTLATLQLREIAAMGLPTCDITLRVTDAMSGEAIDQANVEYNYHHQKSASDGFLTLQFTNLSLNVTKPNYDMFSDDIFINDHCGSAISVALNPISNNSRIALSWNSDERSNLDLRAYNKYGNHVGTLSRDNTNGGVTGGAETLTFNGDEETGPYIVYVWDNSGPGQTICSAGSTVAVYDGAMGQIKTIGNPENCEGGTNWFVGCLSSLSDMGSFAVKNQMTNRFPAC